MAVEEHNGRRGLRALLRDLAEEGIALARSELRLARLEVEDALNAIGRGSALVATGAVLALLGGLSLLAGAILLIGDQWLPRDRYWLGALIVALLAAGLAALFVRRARSRLSRNELGLHESLESLHETTDALVGAVKR
jgi:Putative Actinobacterial Holin-X, holin superfamily III